MVAMNRRQFLTTAGAFGASALIAQAPQRTPLIDVHHHVLPDFWKKATNIPNAWSLEGSLATMEKNGVSTSILSLTAPAVWLGQVEPARALARQGNDYMAKLAQDNPGKFGIFAAIPLPDTEGSLKEIAYAYDTLKVDGIGLMTNYDDKWPGEPAFDAVWQELNRRKAVVYFHPAGATCCGNLVSAVRPQVIEFPHDSTRAATSLLFAGVFAKYRDIRFIFSHGGGTIPYLAGRIATMSGQQKGLATLAPQGIEYEMRQLYYEVAASANAPAMAALMKLAPLDHILFGTDYPFVQTEATLDPMLKLGLSAAELRAISRESAAKLLPRWRA